MKNPHIFIRNAGHIGTPDFDFILSKSGGKHEMIAKVYEEAFRSGKLANLTSTFTKRSITLYGKKLNFTAAHWDRRILISNFFTP